MSGFFDFLSAVPHYSDGPRMITRLNQRRKLIIDPFLPQIAGAKVLDLACHDGRWSYALAAAGAASVTGVEARREMLDQFAHYPDTDAKSRVHLHCSDIFNDLETRAAKGDTFDIVALYGIFYHVMDHFQLLSLIARLKPTLIIIDSEFITNDNAMIQLLQEEVSNPLNAITHIPGRRKTVVGVPSRKATEFMADALNYDTTWIAHDLILGEDRDGMHDYFREGRKQRQTCALVPRERIK